MGGRCDQLINLIAKITLADGYVIDVDYRTLISLSGSITDRSDVKTPSWGVISNSGKLSFIDSNGTIRSLAEQRALSSGNKVEIFLQNTVANIQQKTGDYITDRWSYDNDSYEVSVTLKDGLEEWQDILVNNVAYNPHETKDMDFSWVYKFIYQLTPSKYNMLPYDNLDDLTKSALLSKNVEFWVFTPSNLWSAWNMLCEATQCHIFKNSQGLTICRYSEDT
jgi:hypothetical protein